MTSARGLAVALLLGASCAPSNAQEIGRLFHSVEQRNALDALRKTKPQQQKPPAAQPSLASQSVHLDGYVVRPDGKSMVWVNGQISVRR
ncbi:MAG TPA: hypothetical protein VGP71_01300 [Burkholderiales bacterium]|jgi:hypothetical protein|nr:hypothetical protein [Burkholderiales bacterium]